MKVCITHIPQTIDRRTRLLTVFFLLTDMDVIRVHDTNLTFQFVHELRGAEDLRKAVQYARAHLMQDAVRLEYNVLLSEG